MRNEVLEILGNLQMEIEFCLVGGMGDMSDVLVLVENAKRQIEELWSE